MYWNDFLALANKMGFIDPRLVESRRLTIDNKDIEALVGHIRFYSATYRLFKLPSLDNACEDYGQAVIYKGTMPQHEKVFSLDQHHRIEAGKVFPVCGNTYRMLHETRFAPHFEFIGNMDTHYGIFEGYGASIPFEENQNLNDHQKMEDATSGCC